MRNGREARNGTDTFQLHSRWFTRGWQGGRGAQGEETPRPKQPRPWEPSPTRMVASPTPHRLRFEGARAQRAGGANMSNLVCMEQAKVAPTPFSTITAYPAHGFDQTTALLTTSPYVVQHTSRSHARPTSSPPLPPQRSLWLRGRLSSASVFRAALSLTGIGARGTELMSRVRSLFETRPPREAPVGVDGSAGDEPSTAVVVALISLSPSGLTAVVPTEGVSPAWRDHFFGVVGWRMRTSASGSSRSRSRPPLPLHPPSLRARLLLVCTILLLGVLGAELSFLGTLHAVRRTRVAPGVAAPRRDHVHHFLPSVLREELSLLGILHAVRQMLDAPQIATFCRPRPPFPLQRDARRAPPS